MYDWIVGYAWPIRILGLILLAIATLILVRSLRRPKRGADGEPRLSFWFRYDVLVGAVLAALSAACFQATRHIPW